MNEGEEIAVAIIRMKKLLAGITNKIQNAIGKHNNSPLIQEIIDFIELFKDSVIARMKRTPEVDRMYTINLQDTRIKIAEVLSEFEALQTASEEENSNSEIFFKDVIICLNDEEKLIKNIRETSEVEIPKKIKESISKMLIAKEQGETRKKLLESEINMAERRLLSIIEFNAANEKQLFDECAKVEQEYTHLLAKYDHDIGASHSLMEKLLRDNGIIKSKTKDMEDQLIIQRALYSQLQKEREIALMKVFTEKLQFFKRNRAAKIIQRTWRTYFERISLKRRRRTKRR